MIRSRSLLVLALGLAFALSGASLSVADDSVELSQEELLHLFRTAPPAPNPPPARGYNFEETNSYEQRMVVGRDLETGETTITGANFIGASESAGFEPGGEGVAVPFRAELIEGTDGPDYEIVPSPPTAHSDNTDYPWRTISKMMMRFRVGTTDYFYVCSAWAAGSFHVGTAGHCIYNWDPNDDGNTSDKDWADELWIWAGQGDVVIPLGTEDRPYGEAKGTYMRSYTGWTNSQNYDHDWGVVTLNRRDGDHTGWMGRQWGSCAGSLNFSGYPVETPYVPSGTVVQWYGFDSGNVVSCSTGRITLDAFIYGGHSGGPSWFYDGTSRYVHGIHSTSNRVGGAWDTRITEGKNDDINAWKAADETDRPPVARPDLIEYQLNGNGFKDLLTNSAQQGDTIQVEYNVLNSGFATSSNFTVTFYLSTNTIISTVDTVIGTRTHTVNGWTYTNPVATLTVPANQNPNNYYVGWIISGGTSEYTTVNNTVVISDETVNVTPAPTCALDSYEPDNISAQASTLSPGATQTHSICQVGDTDWMRFTLAAPSAVLLETSGAAGDTEMWLYNGGLALIESDDNSGSGNFSRIDRVCGVDELAAGTYYVAVQEHLNNAEIEEYRITLNTSPCAAPFGLVAPGNGEVLSKPPVFEWNSGDYDFVLFYSYFSYGGSYQPVSFWLPGTSESFAMPASWWNGLQLGGRHLWTVVGYNSKTGAVEVAPAWAFVKGN